MKVFQIENNLCYWDATSKFPTIESTIGFFPSELLFVEAPDNVFEGWGYIDGEFIKPTAPDGWFYDEPTGTFYPEEYDPNIPENPSEADSSNCNYFLRKFYIIQGGLDIYSSPSLYNIKLCNNTIQ